MKYNMTLKMGIDLKALYIISQLIDQNFFLEIYFIQNLFLL